MQRSGQPFGIPPGVHEDLEGFVRDERAAHDLARLTGVGDRVLRALHVAPEGLAVLPRGEEGVCGVAPLGSEELQVEEAGELVDEPRPFAEAPLQLWPIFFGDREVRDEYEHA